MIERHKFYFWVIYVPLIISFSEGAKDNLSAQWIAIQKPKTEEEILEIKRNRNMNKYRRNWEMGQYANDMPPTFDMSERRKAYPQYYAGRYDGFKRYDV